MSAELIPSRGTTVLTVPRPWRYLLPAGGLLVLLAGGAIGALQTDTVGSFGQGVWWALSLVTTVGFAGGAPVTLSGRLLAGALMVLGFALLSLTTAAVASLFIREDEHPAELREQQFERDVLDELRRLNTRMERLERMTHPAPPATA